MILKITFRDMMLGVETVEIFGWRLMMDKKRIIKHYRVVRKKTNTSVKQEKEQAIAQTKDYVSYYELFKSLEK
jgi:hypothetical protein